MKVKAKRINPSSKYVCFTCGRWRLGKRMRVVEILTNGVPRTVCEGCSDKPDKEPPPPFQGVIPNQTLKNLMGEKRWSKMLKFIKSKYGSRRIHFGHHKNGAVAYITKTHKQLGGVAKLETMMKKEKKK